MIEKFKRLYIKGSFERREWNEMKRIILEYFFILLFECFNEMNGKLILLFWNLSGNEWNE